jgi:hypothetical protein
MPAMRAWPAGADKRHESSGDTSKVAIGEVPSRFSVVPVHDGLGNEERANAPSLPRWLTEERHEYHSKKRAGAHATAEALLEYAYALHLHVDQTAEVGDDARASLGECVRLLEAALLYDAPLLVIQELVAALDEQATYIEVCLEVAEQWRHRGALLELACQGTSCGSPHL